MDKLMNDLTTNRQTEPIKPAKEKNRLNQCEIKLKKLGRAQ
jgi:hypothetical protein